MMKNFIHESRSDALNSEIQTLEIEIVQNQNHLNDLKQVSCTNIDDNRLGWVESYKKWDSFEDIEEIEHKVRQNKAKLNKIKKKVSMAKAPMQTNFTCCASHHRSTEVKVAKMTTKERLTCMSSFREDHGNKLYHQGQYADALKWYEKALIYFEYFIPGSNKEEEECINHERLLSLLNSSACCMKLQRYDECIELCSEAIECSNYRSLKAYFRRSQAYRLKVDFDKAQRDLSVATKLDEGEGLHKEDLEKERKLLNKAITEYAEELKSMAKRMMRKDGVIVKE